MKHLGMLDVETEISAISASTPPPKRIKTLKLHPLSTYHMPLTITEA